MPKDSLRAGAQEITQVLREAGYEALLAGGCVRDRLLGLEPKDYDIVTAAPPKVVQASFRRTQAVGASFGVVLVRLPGRREYEVATFRKDGVYLDGRRPEAVEYTEDPRQDVQRRDFTINALLQDALSGEVFDYVGGREDLKRGLIRAVGVASERFAEDRLRMLRAVRFAARFGFELEEQTAAAIRAEAAALGEVSPERVDQELRGIFGSPRPQLGGRLLVEFGLLAAIDPSVVARSERWLAQLSRLAALQLAPALQAELSFALLYLGQDLARVEAALTGLRQSRARIRQTLRRLEAYAVLQDPAASERASGLAYAAAPDAAELHALLTAAEGEGAPQAFAAARAQLAADPLPPRPLLGGADLKALGMKPGPEFKRWLSAVDEAVLERRLDSKEAAIAWLKREAGLLED